MQDMSQSPQIPIPRAGGMETRDKRSWDKDKLGG